MWPINAYDSGNSIGMAMASGTQQQEDEKRHKQAIMRALVGAGILRKHEYCDLEITGRTTGVYRDSRVYFVRASNKEALLYSFVAKFDKHERQEAEVGALAKLRRINMPLRAVLPLFLPEPRWNFWQASPDHDQPILFRHVSSFAEGAHHYHLLDYACSRDFTAHNARQMLRETRDILHEYYSLGPELGVKTRRKEHTWKHVCGEGLSSILPAIQKAWQSRLEMQETTETTTQVSNTYLKTYPEKEALIQVLKEFGITHDIEMPNPLCTQHLDAVLSTKLVDTAFSVTHGDLNPTNIVATYWNDPRATIRDVFLIDWTNARVTEGNPIAYSTLR